MLFNSFEFISVFMPVTILGFVVLGRMHAALAGGWLTIASLFFYGWWNPRYVALLVGSIVFNYALSTWIARASIESRRPRQKLLLTIAIAVDLLVLGYYKYANFFVSNVNALASTHWTIGQIILPLGISFFTFTQISFLVDTYRGEVTTRNFLHYALFVTYFPHLIAGPVLHHSEMMPQFARAATYRLHAENLAVGFAIFSIGLFKKVIVADNVAFYSTAAFDSAASGAALTLPIAWAGVLAYTLQLYFDFSGYSDMALGLSRVFGINLPLNFNSPYQATNIIEFWRRWHMSLSRFLRDYLYVPLGGGRTGSARRYLNLFLTMLLGGLWHGAGWTFVFWGGLHGLYLAVNHGWHALRRRRGHDLTKSTVLGRYLARTVTFLAVVVAWVFFRASTFDSALRVLKGMAGMNGLALPLEDIASLQRVVAFPILFDLNWPYNPFRVLLGVLGVLLLVAWFAPNTQQIMNRYDRAIHPYAERTEADLVLPLRWCPTLPMAFLVALAFFVSVLGLITEAPSPFLYFQF
jgi:alginate O-acetyltransferase complex protein AlgI